MIHLSSMLAYLIILLPIVSTLCYAMGYNDATKEMRNL
jgi:hypothetical protein